MVSPLIFTCSWDDGHPDDLRLAEMLTRHGFAATFFVPSANSEGRKVMTAAEIRSLAEAGFEIGAHGADHLRLTRLAPEERRRQMFDDRRRLEDLLGSPIAGFCYPGGRHDRRTRRLAAELGFRYARTTQMFRLDAGSDPFAMPTTLQFHANGAAGYLRNWLRNRAGLARLRLARRCLAAGPAGGLRYALGQGGVFHLWGHSWEIDETRRWDSLAALLEEAAEVISPENRLTNREVANSARSAAA